MSNHQEFKSKKDALKFLDSHPLMSVGWVEGGVKKEACFFNGKIHITMDVKENKFRTALKEDFQMSKSFGQSASSGAASVGPAKSNHNDLFSSVVDAIPEEEHRKSHDTKFLPYPLDRIINQLGDNYETLVKTRFTLKQTLKTCATLDRAQKETLKQDISYVNKCINAIKKISSDVESMMI